QPSALLSMSGARAGTPRAGTQPTSEGLADWGMYPPATLPHLVHGGAAMSATLLDLSNALAGATERAAGATVAVHTESRGSSSGVIWGPGVIVTADHALRRDEEIRVTLSDSRIVVASLAGRDPSTDLAVLKCAEASLATVDASAIADAKPGALALVVGRTRASGPVATL